MARKSRKLTRSQQAARSRALRAVSDLRRGEAKSLSEAARRRGTTLRTIQRHVPSAIERPSGQRRFRARAGDGYGDVLSVLTVDGVRIMHVRGSRQRRLVGRHWTAVRLYIEHGDDSGLAAFDGITITGTIVGPGASERGRGLAADLLTDPDDLDVMAGRAELDEIDVYALAGSR